MWTKSQVRYIMLVNVQIVLSDFEMGKGSIRQTMIISSEFYFDLIPFKLLFKKLRKKQFKKKINKLAFDNHLVHNISV